MKKQDKIVQKLGSAPCLLENPENSLTVIMGTPECSCEHHLLEMVRKEIIESIKLL